MTAVYDYVVSQIHYGNYSVALKTLKENPGCDEEEVINKYLDVRIKADKFEETGEVLLDMLGSVPEDYNGGIASEVSMLRSYLTDGYAADHADHYKYLDGYCAYEHCYNRPVGGHFYCTEHECSFADCKSVCDHSGIYCKYHKDFMEYKDSIAEFDFKKTDASDKTVTASSNRRKTRSSSMKKYDTYDVYSYSSAQDFADDKYEEFYDYEDDYEDEDEAYEAAEDYWNDHH